MKKLIIVALLLFGSGALIAQTKAGKVDTTKHVSYYACPHHSDLMSTAPGKCARCGMELKLSSKQQMKAAEMKNYKCPVHLDIVSHDSTKCPKCGRKLELSPKEQMKANVTKVYTCVMHPEIALDKEGKCPKCGMKMVEKKSNK